MISYIKGMLAEKLVDSAIVEANGVGYQIFVPASVLERLPHTGEETKLYTYFSVSDAGVSLYGFLARQDLDMFRQLIGVNGVGPKSAMGILSALRPDDLRMAVIAGDVKALSRAPGVGNKTAQRIILDLKDKVSAEDILGGFADGAEARPEVTGLGEVGKEAAEALTALGFSAGEAAGAVRKVPIKDGMTAEEVLKAALAHLAF